MMRCPSCGHENREGATFCGGCAAPLADAIACANCGTPNPSGQKFCDACAAALEAAAPPPRTPTPQPSPALPAAFAGGRYRVQRFLGAGGDLEGLLQTAESHRLPLDHAMRIVIEVRGALEHAHARGIIHRDLKPGNIWLTQEGTAKLGDFGLAVAVDRSRLTMEGMVVGTVAYIAPEQALGRQPDARSDRYSLGVVLCEL